MALASSRFCLDDNSLRKQIARAVQIDLVVHRGCPRLRQIVIRLLNLFRARTMLILQQTCLETLHRASSLFVLGAEFLILQAHQNLSFFYLVAFFHANPGHAARDLRIHADFVMGDNVSARRKHGAARDVTAFRRGPRDFHFRCVRGERAVRQCG